MLHVAEFVPERASRHDWALYHAFRRRRHQERRPEEPIASDDVAETMLRRADPRQYNDRFQATLEDVTVAMLEVSGPRPESPEYDTNRHLLWASVHVLEPHRRRGIARSLMPRALALMDERGATVFSAMAEQEAGHAFLRRLGAEARLTERQSRLDLRQIDWDMVTRWVRDGEAGSPGAHLELHTEFVQGDLRDELAEALTELMNTIPFEDMDHGDIVITPETIDEWHERLGAVGSVNPTYLVRDADGSIVGVTDVVKTAYEPGIVRQNFTGVHPRARGRGLGRWLKAAMLEHVRKAFPDATWILTENAGSNASMLAINHALGFRLHRTATVYQVDRETLRAAV